MIVEDATYCEDASGGHPGVCMQVCRMGIGMVALTHCVAGAERPETY